VEKRAQERNVPRPDLPFRELLLNLRALSEREGRVAPTTGGLLFFGREPQHFLPHSEVRIARFQGTVMDQFIDQADLQGTLWEMIDKAERFIRRNTRRAARIVGFQRREISEYPPEAIREAVCNAVTHRDYQMTGSTVRIMIFDDRIEVNSPGSLPAGVTVENIANQHVLRNELIASYLYDVNYIEKWGMGIRKMQRLMREHGLAEPTFRDLGTFFLVTFTGPGEGILDLLPQEGLTDLRALGLNERQIDALRWMVNDGREMTNRDYQHRFGVSRNTASNDLADLVTHRLIRRFGVGKGTRYQAV
jgi:ATP-dependent DNA helicase RecG